MYELNGQPLNGAFSLGDVNYPENWLEFSLPEERQRLGIVDVGQRITDPVELARLMSDPMNNL